MSRILVAGCSYTESHEWPGLLFAPATHQVTNVGLSGAGNSFIANSVMSNLHPRPDFVFILWSGINRMDFRTPSSKFYDYCISEMSKQVGTIDGKKHGQLAKKFQQSYLWIGGKWRNIIADWVQSYNNIKDPSWPNINNIDEWFRLPFDIQQECLEHNISVVGKKGDPNWLGFLENYYFSQWLVEDKAYFSEVTFQNMMNCGNMLDKLNIPYRFSTIYDMFDTDKHGNTTESQSSLGQAKKEYYYNYVDWSKFIDITPYEYGIKYDLLLEDNFHLTGAGMNQWAGEINKVLQKDQELQHFLSKGLA